MSPKTGRPKVDNPKSNRFSIRLDTVMLEKLDNYCKEHNIKRAEAIRKGIELLLSQK